MGYGTMGKSRFMYNSYSMAIRATDLNGDGLKELVVSGVDGSEIVTIAALNTMPSCVINYNDSIYINRN